VLFNDNVSWEDYVASVIDEWVCSTVGMIVLRKLWYLEKSVPHCHFVYPKLHMDWPGIKP